MKMSAAIVIICLVFGVISGKTYASVCFESSLTDICSANSHVIPKLFSRGPTTLISNETSHWKYCDVYAIDTQKWYRSSSPMTTSCPAMYMCGTKFPIWLNGAHPTPEEGLVHRTSCLKTFDTCCLLQYKLAVVNCTEFTAYCFVDLPSGCHQRYCFDVNESLSTAKMDTVPSTEKTTTKLTTEPIDSDHSTPPNDYLTAGDEDKTFIQVLLACLCVMVVVIAGLVIIIIHNKRKTKVVDEKIPEKMATRDDEMYEILGEAGISYIKDVGSVYDVLSYDHFKVSECEKNSY